MSSLLQSKKLPSPKQTREYNSENGGNAESIAASQLAIACLGEVRWGSREEDNSKIDIILSFEHPWHKGERALILAQIKSGKTYGEPTNKGFKLKASAIKAAQRTSHSICVVWVDRENNRSHWAYIHPRSLTRTQDFGVHHKISPATRYDLAKCVANDPASKKVDGKGVIIREKTGNVTIQRSLVKETYRKIGSIRSPSLGEIQLTRLAWRHMFRKGRSATYKQTSLNLIPYLKIILEQKPSTIAITDINEWENKGYIYRSAEHILKYTSIKISEKTPKNKDGNGFEAIFKVVEEIRYPKNWYESALLTQQVDRRVVLKSAYYKEKK